MGVRGSAGGAVDVVVREAWWDRDGEAIRQVRTAVFLHEQGIPESLDFDGLDDRCFHVLAVTVKGKPVGTGRIEPGGRIGRLAVLPECRGRGIGRRLMFLLIAIALREGLRRITLHAQEPVIPFYEKLGFTRTGEPFFEAGIRHVAMTKTIGLQDLAEAS